MSSTGGKPLGAEGRGLRAASVAGGETLGDGDGDGDGDAARVTGSRRKRLANPTKRLRRRAATVTGRSRIEFKPGSLALELIERQQILERFGAPKHFDVARVDQDDRGARKRESGRKWHEIGARIHD